MSSSIGASNSANAASSSSLARQRHQAPPKVETTLSSTSVASDRAVQLLCQFLESEKSKLSHLDLQQHWVDLHGVATTLCQNEKRYAEHQQDGEGSEKGASSSVDRCSQRLEQMLADVEELGTVGAHGSAVTPLSSTAARHVVFDDDVDGNSNQNVDGDDGGESKEKAKKRKKKEAKKESKKAAKRERKEAKKRLKKQVLT